MTKQVLYGSAVSLAIMIVLSGCSNPNGPAQGPVGAAPPLNPHRRFLDQRRGTRCSRQAIMCHLPATRLIAVIEAASPKKSNTLCGPTRSRL